MKYLHEYPTFFANELRPQNINEILKKLESFIRNKNVIFITSGGTKVPIEKVEVRSLDNFSTGKRGALICEHFLEKNKKVIFLHRRGSRIPFEQHLHHLIKLDNIKIANDNIFLHLNKEEREILMGNIQNYKKYFKNMFLISFETVFEYGYYLIEICNLLNENLKRRYANYFKMMKNISCGGYKHKYQSYIKRVIREMLLSFTNYNKADINMSIKRKSKTLLKKINTFQKLRLKNNNKSDNIKVRPKLQKKIKYTSSILNKIAQTKKYQLKERCRYNINFQGTSMIYKLNNTKQYIIKNNIIIDTVNKKNVKKNKPTIRRVKKPDNIFHTVILCAASSDFFIPYNKLKSNKIESNKSLSLQMVLTPKFYKIINQNFSLLKLCLFKLETDETMLIKKSYDRIQYADMIVANILLERYNYVYIFKKDHDYYLLNKPQSGEIENEISDHISIHFNL